MTNFDHFIGTKPVSSSQVFDIAKLSDWLSNHLPGYEGPLTAQLFKGGQSNPTYKLQTPSRTYVMRAKPGPVAKLLPSAHAIEREYAVMRGLWETDIPVPKMLCFCEDEGVIGRAFYIMEFIPGRVLWDPALPDMTPAQRKDIFLEMNHVIASLHTIAFSDIGLDSYGKSGNYFERQINRWSKQYQASITRPIAEMDQLMQWLPSHIPTMARNDKMVSIVHGDFRLDNLMFAPDSSKVVAVLDWELSTLGHPLADFSYHCMTWHIPSGDFRGIAGLDLNNLGIPTEREYIELYCNKTGFTTPDQLRNDWSFYMAYNMFRVSAILQGIAKRVETGTASSAQAIRSAAGARPLAELAWNFAKYG